MKIEVGQKWISKDDVMFTIIDFIDNQTTNYPLEARSETGELFTFTLDGKFFDYKISSYDLEKHLSKEEYPELYI